MKKSMQTLVLAAAAGLAVLTTTGCAVVRDQQSVGAYVDDATITAAIKTRFVESKAVDAGAVKVETLNGTVQLSGFAKNATEKSQAEQLARGVKGVRAVQNNLTVRS